MFLCAPLKILASLRQILKLSLCRSSTHTAIASWGLLEDWWLAVTNTFGETLKRWKINVIDKCMGYIAFYLIRGSQLILGRVKRFSTLLNNSTQRVKYLFCCLIPLSCPSAESKIFHTQEKREKQQNRKQRIKRQIKRTKFNEKNICKESTDSKVLPSHTIIFKTLF